MPQNGKKKDSRVFREKLTTDKISKDIEFATAAWMMKETKTEKQKPDFAKVDASLPSQLAIKHNVKRFPTILFIKAIIMLDNQFLIVKKSCSEKKCSVAGCYKETWYYYVPRSDPTA